MQVGGLAKNITVKSSVKFMGKFVRGHRYFSGLCQNTPSKSVFAEYHYNFVTYLPQHTYRQKQKG
jgi:hypothetical protein